MKVEDLDILRPEPRYLKLGNKEIDVSFIPCGITFDVDTILNELGVMTQEEIKTDSEKSKRAFDLSIKLCATFCKHTYPEMDEKWFYDNTDAYQVKAFAEAIKDALVRAYSGIEGYQKNQTAPKKKSK
jgi:hypothetical protein